MRSSRPVAPAGYALDAILGRGAITETFVVVRTVGETVSRFVCKRLHSRAETDAFARATLVREGEALRLLDGTCSPRWVGAGTDDAGPWLLMEHVAAPSLAEARKQGLLPAYEDCLAFYETLRGRGQ